MGCQIHRDTESGSTVVQELAVIRITRCTLVEDVPIIHCPECGWWRVPHDVARRLIALRRTRPSKSAHMFERIEGALPRGRVTRVSYADLVEKESA